ncbi:metallophosphoesterase [Bacillaceae bacterium IKA-2]|nr:metallophosphoesterase [Bacillaceae bacterium IKA-2]
MKKVTKNILVFLLLITFLVGYTIWGNHRITVVEQDIFINDLPEELEGFTILQITDLHENVFGKNQSRLLNVINSIDYDVVVFTGDMLDSVESSSYKPFYILLEDIENKETALFVPGNSDPLSYIVTPGEPIQKSDFIVGMERLGVKLLESIHTVEVGQAKVHFVDFEFSSKKPLKNISLIEKEITEEQKEYVLYKKTLSKDMLLLEKVKEKDLLIALTHYPVVDQHIDMIATNADLILRDYDLILAGHYHGGQIRLPFLGAPFVPEPWYDRGGLFPPQDRVKGLWEYRNIKQYVSTGLGSSDAIPLLKFRFFNPPEINVLTLKKN